MKLPKVFHNCRRGSVYVLVLLFATIFSTLIWSGLALQRQQMLLNHDQIMLNQARLLNESLVRLASLQLSDFFEQSGNTRPGVRPSITIPMDELKACLGDNFQATIVEDETEVVLGPLGAPTFRFIDPDIPGRESRQMMGSTIAGQDVPIFSRVTLAGPMNTKVTVYARANYALLASPLFGFSMFFNQDMESSAGADLTLTGAPIYVNGDFAQSTRGDQGSLHVYAPLVLVRGHYVDDIFYGSGIWGGYAAFANAQGDYININSSDYNRWISGNYYATDKLKIPADVYGNARTFAELQNSYDKYPDNNWGYYNWMDQRYNENDKDWYNVSLYNWDGMFKTQAHNVQQLSVPGMDTYNFVQDPTSDEYVNTAYQIIQPARDNDDSAFDPAAVGEDEAFQNRVREKNKFSYKANLIIKLEEKTPGANSDYEVDPDNLQVSYYTPTRDANGDLVYNADGTPQLTSVGAPSDLIEIEAYDDTYTSTSWEYDRRTRSWVEVTTERTSSEVFSGLYDNRRQQPVNLVKLNVGRLKELVDDYGSAGGTEFNADPGANDLVDGNGWWNGGVYVEFPTAETNPRTGDSGPAADGVQPSIKNYGLYVRNGEEIPEQGLTIATNNAMYIVGNFNADGNITADSNSEPDHASEAPASLVADSITVLSNAWESNNNARYSKSRHQDRPAANTEISAAILTGFAPSWRETSTGSYYSGSMANFLRYLEDWGYYLSDHRDLAIRGSQVCLFDSEVGEERWRGNADVYWPPDRLFGYNTLFNTRMPPLTPVTPLSGPALYREVSAATWKDEVATLR